MFDRVILQAYDYPVITTRELLMSVFFSGQTIGLYDGAEFRYGQIERISLESGFTPPKPPNQFIVNLMGHGKGFYVKTV